MMKSKVLIAITVITILAVALIYYLGQPKPATNSLNLPTPTPTTVNSTGVAGDVETSTILVKDGSKSERIIFHNAKGFTFMSYSDNSVTDKIVVSENGNEILQLGVNWTGYTQGSLPLLQVITVKNIYLGTLFRATGGGIADGGYTLAALTKTTGKCTGNGDAMSAPCTNNDQIYGKSKIFTYLPFCSDLDLVEKCDVLMSGLEITR